MAWWGDSAAMTGIRLCRWPGSSHFFSLLPRDQFLSFLPTLLSFCLLFLIQGCLSFLPSSIIQFPQNRPEFRFGIIVQNNFEFFARYSLDAQR